MNKQCRFWFVLIWASAAASTAPAQAPRDPDGSLPAPYFRSDLLRYVEDLRPVQSANQNHFEALCYEQLVLHARRSSNESLSRYSTREINFAHMYGDDRGRYRGALVHVEGRLRLLRQYEPPETLKGLDPDLTHLYEAWIFADEFGGNPYCVVFTDLPAGLAPSETIDRRVQADAFFFKRYRYEARDGWRDAPLLIGKTIATAAEAGLASSRNLWDVPAGAVGGVFAVIGLTGAVAIGSIWWFRRADRRVRDRLARIQPAGGSPLTVPSWPESDESAESAAGKE